MCIGGVLWCVNCQSRRGGVCNGECYGVVPVSPGKEGCVQGVLS
jgi:hypothetical protein